MPVVATESVVFHLKSNPIDLSDEPSKQKLNIGVNELAPTPLLDKLEKDGVIRIERVADDDVSLNRLLYRSLDGVLITKNVGLYYLSKLSKEEQNKITYSNTPVRSVPMYLVISKKIKNAEELVRQFNNGIRKIEQNGRLDQIIREYTF
ncbi:transporter substrate-binding domain-containing protein [Vibrio hannami]|uniref:transporter substrate-binding domain-containing protein n=1 Tax=Vibrio hannami TaxID=2717094 RepID=UPI0024100011|nr:transporter substrate-binding domain-containing protein [Vibrio hannami]MDG3085118.1 transporter substrate-binding domain-containing protein [Vibrio hannami]